MEEKRPIGRPAAIDQSCVDKLEQAFAIGCSKTEACLYADISRQTLYDYFKEHPDFLDKCERLKERPVLKARGTVVKSLDEPEHAKWYLERKLKSEFGTRNEVNLSGTLDLEHHMKKASEMTTDELMAALTAKKA